MSEFSVTSRYAKALYEYAGEKNSLEKISKDILMINNTLDGSKELRSVLQSPVIKPEKKQAIIKDLFAEKVDHESLNFLNFIIEKNREDLLYGITKRFMRLSDEHAGIMNGKVTSAVELDDLQRSNIKKRLEEYTNKKVRLSYVLDRSIIGGFIVKIEDTVLDASVRHQLEILKEKFTEGSLTFN